MKLLPLLLCAILLIPCAMTSQTAVDKVTHALDSVSLVSLDGWRVSPDLKKPVEGDPTQPGYDDSKWDVLKLNQSIYPDSVWLRKEFVLPPTILGQPVTGSIRFLVSVDDYGYLWVNGKSLGYFPWDGDFEILSDAKPGQKICLAIKAVNTGGPLRIMRAEIQTGKSKPVREMIQDLSISLRVGQKLLGFDTYQTNSHAKVDPKTDLSKMNRDDKVRLGKVLQDAVAKIDVEALAAGNIDKFTASVQDVKKQLKPVGDFVRQYTLFFDANAHIDAAWLWRERETVEVCHNTFNAVLNMMDAHPDFTYTQSSAAYYDWMETHYPDLFKRIGARVKDGRWELIGGMWVEPDCNLPSGESWTRQLLYADRYFRAKFGTGVHIGWNPDSFGYNGNMPMFYSNAGIDAFITQKIGWNEKNVFPYRLFWWESPDGSRILSYFPFDYVNTVDDPYRLTDWLRQFDANTGVAKMMILFGVGDHGGGPTDDMLDRIEHLKKLDIYPSIEYGTATQYLDWIKKQNLPDIPVWKSELYLEYHQGTYTTQAKMKESNRRMEVLLTNAEKLSSLATLTGRQYAQNDLREAWTNVLFNQFHDLLPGSGIREIYIDAAERYAAARTIGSHEMESAISAIAGQINTSKMKNGTPVVVSNPLAWERSGVTSLSLPEGMQGEWSVFDGEKEIPSTIHQNGKYGREISFLAGNVPSMGYKVFQLRKQKPSMEQGALKATASSIENELFKVTVDPMTGWVSSIIDKRNGKELCAGSCAELQMLEDKPSAWDAWNIGLTGVQYPTRLQKIEVLEDGPVRATLRVTRDYLKPGTQKDPPTQNYPNSFFTQDISLVRGSDRIEFTTNVDWWEDKTMLKVAFPVTLNSPQATYEIPYGSIERSTQWRDSWDSAKVEVPAQRWAELAQGDYGISLLNRSKYGYDIKGNVMRLSLLRSPKWPDPTADRGKHTIEYALYPHSGSWQKAGTVRQGYDYNNPLIASMTTAHAGKLPPKKSYITLEPSNCVLTTVKKDDDSNAWVIQWYESSGVAADAVLTLPVQPSKVVESNILEKDGVPVKFEKNTVKLPTGKNAVKTIKVYF
jgi:alpha-mannosidase